MFGNLIDPGYLGVGSWVSDIIRMGLTRLPDGTEELDNNCVQCSDCFFKAWS